MTTKKKIKKAPSRTKAPQTSTKQHGSWKKGRGKLGPLDPLLGRWVAIAETPMGPIRCVRTFRKALGSSYIILNALWEIPGKAYEEHALYGANEDGVLSFWSFTSDGKRSTGTLSDGSDVDPAAVSFEAEMPAGLARMVYWPGAEGTVRWAVESKTKKGWKRFTLHEYTRA